ncbi:hypothetical protein LINPERHAP2_LOCUS27879 [Linum perenne]
MKRNPYPNEFEAKESVNSSRHTQIWHRKGEYCPEATVPILRSSMENLPPKKPSNRRTSHYTNSDAPKVADSEVTDFNPHPSFFTYWTNDGYQTTGCFNLLCPGFVLLSTRVSVGARLEPISRYDGIQKVVSIRITQDLKSGNWFLYFQNELVGYWPADLFTNLKTSATLLEWGGEIINKEANGTHTGTQMGSGHFPSEGHGKAAYFRSLEYVDGGGLVNSATDVMGHATRPECYDIAVKDPVEKFGVYFYFGGPGLSIECYS